MVLPIIVLCSTIFFPIGMKLSGIIGSRLVILIGGLVTVGLVYLSASSTMIIEFFLLYAVGFGVGKGFLYPGPLKAGWSHLPGRKGLVSGLVVSGLGIGAFIFGIVTRLLVNPENLPPASVEVAEGV